MAENPRLIMQIDPQLRNEFKAKCTLQGKTMKEVLTKFMENYNPEKLKVFKSKDKKVKQFFYKSKKKSKPKKGGKKKWS